MPGSNMTTISFVNGKEADVAVPTAHMDQMVVSALRDATPFMKVPTITGEMTLVVHQIVAWYPKSSVPTMRDARNQTVTTGGQKRNKR